MYLEERRREIVNLVNQQGRASVSDLSRRFGVSSITIRADLQALEDRNLVVRTHGGAVPTMSGLHVLPLVTRRQQQVSEKHRIGVAAAALVSAGEAIFLDSSSTSLAIAQNLKKHRDLTIITNSIMIAQEMLDAPSVSLVMPGGTLRRETASFVGLDGLDMLRKLNIQKGFFGAHGITLSEGLTDVSVPEADSKRPLIAMCREIVVVLDATKWGRIGLASFADLKSIHRIITDIGAPVDLVEQARALGISVTLV